MTHYEPFLYENLFRTPYPYWGDHPRHVSELTDYCEEVARAPEFFAYITKQHSCFSSSNRPHQYFLSASNNKDLKNNKILPWKRTWPRLFWSVFYPTHAIVMQECEVIALEEVSHVV